MSKKLYYLPVYLGLLSIALSIPLAVLKLTSKAPTQQVVTQATESFTTISIFPQKATYKLKSEIPIGVIYESNSENVKALDVVLTFDPKMAEVTSVSQGILMDSYKTLKFDNKLGQVVIFGENSPEKPVNGILVSLKFKPKKEGIVTFSFAAQTNAEKSTNADFVITK